jgi:hypothetical protein
LELRDMSLRELEEVAELVLIIWTHFQILLELPNQGILYGMDM